MHLSYLFIYTFLPITIFAAEQPIINQDGFFGIHSITLHNSVSDCEIEYILQTSGDWEPVELVRHIFNTENHCIDLTKFQQKNDLVLELLFKSMRQGQVLLRQALLLNSLWVDLVAKKQHTESFNFNPENKNLYIEIPHCHLKQLP